MGPLGAHDARDVGFSRAVAAKEDVVPARRGSARREPTLARRRAPLLAELVGPADLRLRRLGTRTAGCIGDELVELRVVEAGRGELVALGLQLEEDGGKHRVVPGRLGGDAVVGDGEEMGVGRIEIEVADRHAVEAELLRSLPPRVPSDDSAVLATREDRRAEPEALDALGDLPDRLAVVLPRVVLPRAERV